MHSDYCSLHGTVLELGLHFSNPAAVPQESVLEHVLLDVFVSDLDQKMECTVFVSADDTKTGDATDTLDGRGAIHLNLDRMEDRLRNVKHL